MQRNVRGSKTIGRKIQIGHGTVLGLEVKRIEARDESMAKERKVIQAVQEAVDMERTASISYCHLSRYILW